MSDELDSGTPTAPARPRGAIVLAAYQPDPELFARQLRSLAEQTVSDWECVISVDGDRTAVDEVLAAEFADDPRFRVVADGVRRGFYLNFEHGIRQVADDAEWIALSDQDDHWYPEKLETLLPHLDEVSIVSGQARLVAHPSGEVLGTTDRVDRGGVMTALNNQFTGSLLVFDVELLSTALPFPRLSSRAVAHDHWLAVVASTRRGTRIVDTVVQDYVQHANNVFGDPSRLGASGLVSAARSVVTNATAFTRRYEGRATPAAVLRMTYWVYVGWRQLMADTLRDRDASPMAQRLWRLYGRRRRLGVTLRLLARARRADAVPARFVVEYVASWFCGVLVGGRRRRPTVQDRH